MFLVEYFFINTGENSPALLSVGLFIVYIDKMY
jgi:hypothetical protein